MEVMDTAVHTIHRRPELPLEVQEWIESFRMVSDSDAELQAQGKFYTCAFLLDLGERQIFVRMNRGKVDDLVIDPGPLDERYQFALRASPETWAKFATATPPPMFNGIWAAAFQRDMSIEGDILVLMQNLRAFTRQLELLRETGVPLIEQES